MTEINDSTGLTPRAVGDTEPDRGLWTLAMTFADTVVSLRRVARRVARDNLPDLPSSESELLALVGRVRGIGVNEAARMLQLSPNTVSTLVTSLTRSGLLERLSDPADKRAALLHLTAAGKARISKLRERKGQVLTGAMGALSEEDRDALAQALPVMRRLLEELKAYDPGGGES